MRQPLLILTAAVLLAACGDAPRPVSQAEAPVTASRPLPPGHPDIGMPGLPPGHPEMGAGGEGMITDASFAGTAVLAGPLATAEGGFLLVSVRPKGMRMPLMSYKITLDDQARELDDQGRRRVPFRLDAGSTQMPFSGIPEGVEIELEARYDPDGFVETREGVVSQVAPVEPVAQDLELVLGG